MSDCFPSLLHFGKVFPVEEINKFQDDISFFIQKNMGKNPLGYFPSLLLTIYKNLSEQRKYTLPEKENMRNFLICVIDTHCDQLSPCVHMHSHT